MHLVFMDELIESIRISEKGLHLCIFYKRSGICVTIIFYIVASCMSNIFFCHVVISDSNLSLLSFKLRSNVLSQR